MGIALTELVARLKADVPPYNNIPSDDQYTRIVQESVLDYGARAPATKVWELSIIPGVGRYELPADFVRLIDVPSIEKLQRGGVVITGQGIIPTTRFPPERFVARGNNLLITPVPQYSITRPIIYSAGFALVGDEYPELAEADAAILLHKARALVLYLIADGVARYGWRYSLADESVDKTTLPGVLREQAKVEEVLYEQMIRTGVATRTIRAEYNWGEYE